MVLKIRMPKEDIEKLQKIFSLPEGQQEFIIESLEKIKPESVLEDITEIEKGIDLNLSELSDFISVLESLNINFYEYGQSIGQYIQDVIIFSITYHNIELEINEEQQNLLRRVIQLDKPLGILSKVAILYRKSPNNIANFKIVTDLRHIFYEDPLKVPEYALITHTLVAKYIDKQNRFTQIFLTLDNEDLLELKKNIERAIIKEKTLKELCKKTNIKILKEIDWYE